jgi:putative FmdB family regulatory protein
MPLYEYFCKSCNTYFERRRPASEYAAPALCAEGHKSARRVVSMFATISTGGSAPPVTMSGCGCGGGACGCGS